MKTQVLENEHKTRRAVVHGKHVYFYRRNRTPKRYTSLYPVWQDKYRDRESALAAATMWVKQAKLVKPTRDSSEAASTAQRDEQVGLPV